jgi:hypothetical protein
MRSNAIHGVLSSLAGNSLSLALYAQAHWHSPYMGLFNLPGSAFCRDIQVPQEAPAEVAQLINECLQPNPALRPTAAQLYDCIQVWKCSGCVVHDGQGDRVNPHASRIVSQHRRACHLFAWATARPAATCLRPLRSGDNSNQSAARSVGQRCLASPEQCRQPAVMYRLPNTPCALVL